MKPIARRLALAVALGGEAHLALAGGGGGQAPRRHGDAMHRQQSAHLRHFPYLPHDRPLHPYWHAHRHHQHLRRDEPRGGSPDRLRGGRHGPDDARGHPAPSPDT